MINEQKVQIHEKLDFDEPSFELTIDGYVIEGVTVVQIQSSHFGRQVFAVYSDELTVSDKLASLETFEFIKANILALGLEWKEIGIFSVNIGIDLDIETHKKILTILLSTDLLLWNRLYTFIDYLQEFEKLLSLSGIGKLDNDNVGSAIKIDIETSLENQMILEEINIYLDQLIGIHYKTLENLDPVYDNNAILTFFDFPESIKANCEQYLLYFAQFLRDLGINATPNLKEQAGKVLFSVTPIDDTEALDRIREALAVYLNLPSSPVLYNDSFQSMQLKQQVENLQHSQRMKEMEMRSAQYALRLAQQNIENQDKIIVQQNSHIDNQNKIIEKIMSKSIMIDSLENKEELEKFCEGFEVGKSELLIKHFGLHLNPATVLKNAGKKILGKGENKSVLGLDEEAN